MTRFFSKMLIVSLAVILYNCSVKVIKDPVLFEINEEEVTKSEFIKAYEKNNKHHNVVDRKTPEEYLDLYINFRLKLKEAKSLGLDTAESFVEELNEYRQKLTEPFLTDTQVTRELIREAYERMQFDIRASHILVSLPDHAPPEDTLEAYNKIMDLRGRIIEGEDFGTIAEQYSDDPTARSRQAMGNQPATKGNRGDLGYFSVFNTIYTFESAAYNTEPGEISMPVRSHHGYHIIKVTDKKPALGEVKIAHIMIKSLPNDPDEKKQKAEIKINEIYEKVAEGQPFDQLAIKYSEDEQSAAKGGILPTTQANRILPEFVEALHQINETGNFTEPLKTDYGWHIIKIIEKSPPQPYDEIYHELEQRVKRDQRFKQSLLSVINKLKQEYNFREYPENLEIFYEILDNSIFMAAWTIPSEDDRKIIQEESPVAGFEITKTEPGPALDEVLFEFAGKTYTQKDFAKYLYERQTRRMPLPITAYVNRLYEAYRNNLILDYEDNQLEEKYPEFKEVLKEYHDGILLFELSDKMVWSKSMEDTSGLKEFYENNISNYMSGQRIHATIYDCRDKKIAGKVRNQLKQYKDYDNPHELIIDNINIDKEQKVVANRNIFEISEKELFEKIDLQKEISEDISINDKIHIVHVHEMIEPQPKPLNEIRGKVIADYQNYLEKKWMEELKEKYRVKVNKDVLSEIVDN